MEQFKGKNILNFVKELPNDDKFKEYLAKYKWQDGFVCNICQGTKGCMTIGFKYHCYTCHHVEVQQQIRYFTRLSLAYRKHFVLCLK